MKTGFPCITNVYNLSNIPVYQCIGENKCTINTVPNTYQYVPRHNVLYAVNVAVLNNMTHTVYYGSCIATELQLYCNSLALYSQNYRKTIVHIRKTHFQSQVLRDFLRWIYDSWRHGCDNCAKVLRQSISCDSFKHFKTIAALCDSERQTYDSRRKGKTEIRMSAIVCEFEIASPSLPILAQCDCDNINALLNLYEIRLWKLLSQFQTNKD